MRASRLLPFLLVAALSCGNKELVNPTAGRTKYITTGTTALSLPYIISNKMVLQQRSEVKIWGSANSGVKVTVMPSWTTTKYEQIVPVSGKWSIKLDTPEASFNPYTITITDSQGGKKIIYDVLIGEVWMCAGQSNMEHPMRGFGSVATGNFQPIENAEQELADADIPSFRYFKVKYQLSTTPMDNTKESSWSPCNSTNAAEYEAFAFFIGRHLQRTLNVPIGIIGCAYGGTRIEAWMSPESLRKFSPDEYKDVADLGGDELNKSAPSNIWNGMVLPVMDYRIRGWFWYQGESNRDNYASYSRLQAELVASWRAAKGDGGNTLPFYYMQIAPFNSEDNISGADMRDAQMAGLALIPNSGISSASDCGSQSTIHYPAKKAPALRLALWPLYNEYGKKDVNPMGPAFSSMEARDGKLIVSLSNAEGLRLGTGVSNVSYAQIAGSDGAFTNATVKIIDGNKLEFSAASVSNPVHARYCYFTWHVGTLFNGAGLPLFPFKASLQ